MKNIILLLLLATTHVIIGYILSFTPVYTIIDDFTQLSKNQDFINIYK